MPRSKIDAAETAQIDAALATWRQGDFAVDEQWFVHVGDPKRPLTDAAAEASESEAGVQALTVSADGLVMLSQACDIVRSCSERPYVDVGPALAVDDDELVRIERGHYPNLATVPGLRARGMAVDLDRVMTVEKSVVAGWNRSVGCTTDEETRLFAQALARKRARFAYPDDFVAFIAKLRTRLIGKHEKNTDEGRGLRHLREIRVQASPEWDAARVELMFWFVRHDADPTFEKKSWSELLEGWLDLIPAGTRFSAVAGEIVALADMTAEDYVSSDPLDLDHLSGERAIV